MARTVHEVKIDSPKARADLKASGKPYYREIDAGVHLGYRKGSKFGVWVWRRYLGTGQYLVKSFGFADDNRQADGEEVLSFQQARTKLRELDAARRAPAAKQSITIRQAIEAYCEMRETRETARGGALRRDARSRLSKHVLSDKIADIRISDLTEDALASWRKRLRADLAPMTVRRLIGDFKASLNAAAKAHRKALPADIGVIVKNGLASDGAISGTARAAQILPDPDVRRVIADAKEIDDEEGWEGDFARLIVILAATGARFGQISRMTVADVQAEGRLMVPVSAKGQGKKQINRIAVRVGADVIAALNPAVAGRKGHEPLLERWRKKQIGPGQWERDRRGAWAAASEMTPTWALVVKRAGLEKGTIPYCLRHSSIVRGLRAGLPTRLVASLHDTSVKMIEAHYSAYIVDAMDDLSARSAISLTSAPVIELRPLEQARW